MRTIVLSNEEIQKITKRIADQLATRYRFNDYPPIVIGVMKGALPFMTDLVSKMDIPLLVDYIQIGSYNGTETTGTVILKKDVTLDINGRDIVIVEDIVDSGISMNYLVDYFKKKYNPASLVTVTLLDKKCNRKVPFEVDYYGYEVQNQFLMGYGLDYNEIGRNLNYVYIPDAEEIAAWDKASKN